MLKETCWRCAVAIALLGSLALLIPGRASTRSDAPPQLRRPVALALADGGKLLFVANQRSGTVSVIDTAGLRTVAELEVGHRLSDLAVLPGKKALLAVDEAADELILLSRHRHTLRVVHRVPVSPGPVSLQLADEGRQCFVASLWARRLSVVQLGRPGRANEPAPRVHKTITLPFAPRRQLLAPDGARLIVADAFGGRLALVDIGRGSVDSVRRLPAHNIRGLAWSADGKDLLVSHQVLNGLAETTLDDVHWGNVMTNTVRVLPAAAVLSRRADLLRGGRLYQLGDVGRGAGDPAGLAVGAATVVVALAGVGEVALGPDKEAGWQRLAVGRSPTAVTISPDGRRAYVANTFADSVSIVDLDRRKVLAEVALGRMPELGAADRGELLFHDARLAHDGWFSCHSCHSCHTDGLLNDNLGDGSFGAPKRILSLRGVKDTGPWAWNGSMPDLPGQIRKSILTTMRGRKPARDQVEALAAYVRTLPPAPPLGKFAARDDAAVRRGREVFDRQGCGRCHAPPTYTSPKTYDVGLSDEVGNTRFNPPSLRGVSQGGPFFHDNRAATLTEVFARYRHQLKSDLTKNDLDDLLTFLDSL
ncbi:MAG TPA: cytochrome c peroxidase [Gemmataceae bacterium]|jgi:YVTN family beta-propeller protein|nr:cytochrome c peroxidase [Gemmataceae bacterium]